jgi:hypothetical protein
MEEMIQHISREPLLKKSIILAKALADDYTSLTGSTSEAIQGGTHRKGRFGPATPGVFVRATTYKVAWYEFITRKEANSFSGLLSSSLNPKSEKLKPVTEHTRDYGILELLTLLKEKGSLLTHTGAVYKTISLGLKFGI